MPPEIAEQISRDQAAHQPNYTDDYANLTRDDWTLRYYYVGEMVVGRSTPEGIEVLAVPIIERARLASPQRRAPRRDRVNRQPGSAARTRR